METFTNDCDSEITPPQLNDLSQIIYSLLMPIVCLLGVVGAIICVFIFTRHQMRSSLSIYLAALSGFDFVLLICAAIIYPSMNMCLQEGNNGPICHFFWRTSLATYPLSLMAQTASVWTVIAITIDRYLAVRYPLHTRAWCTANRAKTVVFFITIVAVLFKMPSFFEVSLDECGHLMKTSLRDHRLYFTIYYTYGYLLLMLVTPFLFIIILNARILTIIHQANLERHQMNVVRRSSKFMRNSQGSSGCVVKRESNNSTSLITSQLIQNNIKQQSFALPKENGKVLPNNTSSFNSNILPNCEKHQVFENISGIAIVDNNRCTKMAVVTISAFITFNLLAGLNHVIEAFNLMQDDGQNLRIPIGNFLVCLNSATNILIYSIFGRRFRKMFVIKFCPCWLQKYSELNRSNCQNNKTIDLL
ncbi:hypothetical protein Mgra_00005129 [Meloidogyne graminicola]|uniref:G-protein coupled receptors family 1 profile domain-containing protein n=1 Tax=Meloidogyne graminicola TaxID=189291 RepID=A0A8S9ZQC3_9BILA|nr:hypothetical protein Mgra_00005129 [Meloidogyne graminicola]